MLTMWQRISNFFGRYFYGCGCGVVRMNNAINQFRGVVDELNKAAEEITTQQDVLLKRHDELMAEEARINRQFGELNVERDRALMVAANIGKLLG